MTGENKNKKKNNRLVPWSIFISALGIVFLIIGLLFNAYRILDTSVQAAVNDNTEIKIQLREIQTDVRWIKDELARKR